MNNLIKLKYNQTTNNQIAFSLPFRLLNNRQRNGIDQTDNEKEIACPLTIRLVNESEKYIFITFLSNMHSFVGE